MDPLIGNSQTQLLWSYHSELSLTVDNEGAHILETFEKHPHLGGQSPPSGTHVNTAQISGQGKAKNCHDKYTYVNARISLGQKTVLLDL